MRILAAFQATSAELDYDPTIRHLATANETPEQYVIDVLDARTGKTVTYQASNVAANLTTGATREGAIRVWKVIDSTRRPTNGVKGVRSRLRSSVCSQLWQRDSRNTLT